MTHALGAAAAVRSGWVIEFAGEKLKLSAFLSSFTHFC
jgi:hypothetical protein